MSFKKSPGLMLMFFSPVHPGSLTRRMHLMIIQWFSSLPIFDNAMKGWVAVIWTPWSLMHLSINEIQIGLLGRHTFIMVSTGLAWAGRRDWIERYGLYDCCLSGTADHLMAHTFIGDWQPGCIGIGQGPAYRHFVRWSERVYHR